MLLALEKKVCLLGLDERFSGCWLEPVAEDSTFFSVPPHFLLGGFAVVGRAVLGSPTALAGHVFSPCFSLSLFLHILCSSDVVPIHLGCYVLLMY